MTPVKMSKKSRQMTKNLGRVEDRLMSYDKQSRANIDKAIATVWQPRYSNLPDPQSLEYMLRESYPIESHACRKASPPSY